MSDLKPNTQMMRSPGIKLLLVCGLALVMTIPALFVFGIVFDRSSRAETTRSEIAAAAGGPQKVTGPVLVVPVELQNKDGIWQVVDTLLLFAERASASAVLDVTTRQKSLYKVQVYGADLAFEARFDLAALKGTFDTRRKLALGQAQILIGVSDLRGALGDAWLDGVDGAKRKFAPFSGDLSLNAVADVWDEDHVGSRVLNKYQFSPGFGQAISVPVGDLLGEEQLQIKVNFKLGGGRQFSLVPFASTTDLSIKGNWPHPGFGGEFLPTTRQITEAGFQASRTIPSLASGLPALAYDSTFTGWNRGQTGMQVKLVEKSSPYQYVSRSLKYALLFIGFVFLAYFLFEMKADQPVHAAQYVLVGLAQSVFYLLLLAFSEHIGFDLAFAIAAISTVGLTALYAGAVFGRAQTGPAIAVFGSVYGLLFVLMRLEDYALLVGAISAFGAIATTMWMTRNLQWYGAPGSSGLALAE
ncbi:MAG: cell envelope integrity protein CreD [Robiginitomaculum sp.]|nr:MAG: cell envelope integrity protein CreD [Robiginitomaculum sp.]